MERISRAPARRSDYHRCHCRLSPARAPPNSRRVSSSSSGAAFSKVHAFTYSEREGTTAADDGGPGRSVDGAKAARARHACGWPRRRKRPSGDSQLGQKRPRCSGKRSAAGLWQGMTDNYIRVSSEMTAPQGNPRNVRLPRPRFAAVRVVVEPGRYMAVMLKPAST